MRKKVLAILLSAGMVLSLAACGGSTPPATETPAQSASTETADAPAADKPAADKPAADTPADAPAEPAAAEEPGDDLVAAAQAEGALVVYGSCEEEYLQAACEHFSELYGIKVDYQRLSTGEVQAKIEEENGNPSGDVWFGGTTDPYNECAGKGLLEAYEANNASHLLSDMYRDKDGYWYGIYKGILGFMVNRDELARLGVDAPKDWQDLKDPKYKDLIWLSNYNTAGTAKLVVNTMIQKYGHDEGIQYLVDLDKNIQVYTKSGSGPSKNVGTGECIVGIGFLHDGITQIVDNGYENIDLIIPSSGTSFEVGATAIFKGAKHPNAAKLWIEYALSPECVELAAQNGSYQFLVLDNAKQPEQAVAFGLDPENVMKYDFEDAKQNTSTYVEEVMKALGGGDDRFKTE
ncbi:MAG: ABC transporter substrate-binding protein [Lachnospiraceae bacterium]|nr:ABC transporter substrate-binding protein [Lachnospiraceae bacterium]